MYEFIVLFLIIFLIALNIGQKIEAKNWRYKGKTGIRMYSGGKFWYVLPEDKYDELLESKYKG